MERRNLFKLTGLAAAIMFSTGTLAASDQQASFQELDKNRDGKLTPSELSEQPEMARQWNDIDKDNSNAIERSEFSAFEDQQKQGHSGSEMASNKLPKFEELDHNGDGKLTTSEVQDEAALTAQWTEIDQDDSDTLDRSEFSAFEEQRQQRDLQQQSQSKQQGGQQESAQQGEQETSGQQRTGEMAATELPEFDKLDKDRNGKLSPSEVSDQPALATQWTEIDQDDSDTLDRSEFSAFEEKYKSSEQQKQSGEQPSDQQRQQSGQEGASTQSGAAAGATMAAGSQAMTERGQINHPLYSMSPDELQGQEVMGASGEKLGTVSKVVSDRSSGRIHVVVSGGGFLGIASRENAFPLDDLQMQEGVLTAPVTKEELETRGEYTEDAYVEVQPEDRPISEFSAFEESGTQDDSMRSPGESSETEEPKSSQYGQ